MSLSNNQPATAEIFNSNLASKIDANNYLGVQNLKNPSSGADVNNLQQVINNILSILTSQTLGYAVFETESIASGGQVSISNDKMQLRMVQGDSGVQTISATPFGGEGLVDGTVIELVGVDDDDYVILEQNDDAYGALINGTIYLKRGVRQRLIWSEELLRWIDGGSSIWVADA